MENQAKNTLSKELIKEITNLGVGDKGKMEIIRLKSQLKVEIDNLFDRILSDILIENTALKGKNNYLEIENHNLKKKLYHNA